MLTFFLVGCLACLVMAVVDIFEPRTMIEAVRQMKPAKTFIRDLLFKRRIPVETEHVDIDLVKDKRRMAPYVSPVIGGVVMDRMGYTTESFKPPYLKPRRITTAEDVLKRQAGENIYSGRTATERATDILGNDMGELGNYCTRREEQQCCEALFTGKLVVVGEGVHSEVDFHHTLKETLVGAAQWDEPTSDPIGDLDRWIIQVQQASGISPNVCVMAADVLRAFLNNESVQAKMDTTKIKLGVIDPQPVNGALYVGTVTSLGLDIYRYVEWYLDDTDHVTERPMVPDGNVLLASTEASFKMVYGLIVDMKLNQRFQLAQYPRSWVDEDVNARFLEMMSRPLPIPVEVDSWFVADVI